MPEAPTALRSLVDRTDQLLTDFWFGGDRSALNDLVNTWSAIIAHPSFASSDPEFQLFCYDRAGLARCWRWEGSQKDSDMLETAREYFELVLAAGPAWSNDVRYHLSVYHLIRSTLLGSPADAESAVAILRDLLDELPPEDVRLRPRCLDVLARALLQINQHRAGVVDLDEVVALADEALAAFPANLPYRDILAVTSATALLDRYRVTGRIADIDKAIERVQATRPDTQGFASSGAMSEGVLAVLLKERYRRGRNIDDLGRSLEWHKRSVLMRPRDPLTLSNYGNTLLEAYTLGGGRPLLEQALAAHSAAVDETPPESSFLPSRLNNLATSLSKLFDETGNPRYIDQAIELCERAIKLAPAHDAHLPARHYNLATRYAVRYAISRHRRDRREATRHFLKCCESGLDRDAEWALKAAQGWRSWAGELGAWGEAAEASEFGVRAMESLFANQATRADKESWLREAQALPSQAAYAMARAHRVSDAVIIQERSRGLLLSEALRKRRQTEPGLLGQEMPDLSEIFAAAGAAPLVYLNAADLGGVAFIVDPRRRKVHTHWLPDVTQSAVEKRAALLLSVYGTRTADNASWLGTIDAIGRWAHDKILGPVLARLRHLGLAGADVLTLVPAGQLAVLPLHAAWTPDPSATGKRRYAVEEVAINYVPTARARARRSATPGKALSALIVDEPQPVTAAPLPWSSIERAAAASAAQDAQVLSGPSATKATVLAELGRHQLIHLSCHGSGRPAAPLASSLLMADDEALTLGDIIESFPPEVSATPSLVVLSACETYQVGVDLPDEVVSFPTALLQIGCQEVIATQWSVSSMCSALLTAAFYLRWKRGVRPVIALWEAQRWLRSASNGELADALHPDRSWESVGLPPAVARPLWQSLRLRDPQEIPFAHPSEWAAFAHIGS